MAEARPRRSRTANIGAAMLRRPIVGQFMKAMTW
jgi:hypothetical protein